MQTRVRVIGAGLAGSEAAWQCALRGIDVELCEMRPVRATPAHQTGDFAELVCSNSLKSESENTAPWLLKEEMRRAGSMLLEVARECAVPAGHALAVDRALFAARVTERIEGEPRIAVRREEVIRIEEDDPEWITIIATGPLTSDGLAAEIGRLCRETSFTQSSPGTAAEGAENGSGAATGANGQDARAEKGLGNGQNQSLATVGVGGIAGQEQRQNQNLRTGVSAPQHALYFYDSISPIVEADSIDMSRVYLAARYDKGSADYINCPMSKEEYDRFYDALVSAEAVEEREWEKLNYFESCLPIEEIARRGRDTLRFGPMKPVGLRDPRTERQPYAVVQLRQENLRADSYNLVGFQNHLKFGDQARVLRLIPGLEQARFLRYGQIHRNTYINSPTLLRDTLQMKAHPRVLFAGQICGVEGYVESIATGLLAGVQASALAAGGEAVGPARASAFGSLTHYITQASGKNFQPANITFDLLPALEKKVRDRKERHAQQCARALRAFEEWWAERQSLVVSR
jgi:methylenetetrahydrofolate--tRNA-(uracil-5-)-methyltransferase